MPELPEVEHFRQILLPLVYHQADAPSSSSSSVVLECPPPAPTKRFPSQEVIDLINDGCYIIKDVLRKGKVLCVVLQKQTKSSSAKMQTSAKKVAAKTVKTANDNDDTPETNPITGQEAVLYLSLHMGMTGRISSPDHVPGLESLSENDTYPPPHTHLILKSNGDEAAFSDPRRFGSVLVDVGVEAGELCHVESIPTFQGIAIDALQATEEFCSARGTEEDNTDTQQPTLVDKIANRKKGIKGLLLDQRAVFSGVGNWVADEVLYRSGIHPDQSYLIIDEATKLVEETYHVLSTAVTCLNNGDDLPKEWLFHRRWRNGGGGGGTSKDYTGKTITFIQSGGRSTAIVPSLQKIKGRSKVNQAKKASAVASKKSNDKINMKVNTSGAKKAKAAALKSNECSSTMKTKAQGQKRKHDSKTSSKPQTQPTRRSKRLASD